MKDLKAPKDKRVAQGVYQTFAPSGKVSGWRVYVRAGGKLQPKRLPKKMTLGEVKAWRTDYKSDLRRGRKPAVTDAAPRTFGGDVNAYLEAVRTMPTYETRRRHMLEWVEVLGPLIDRDAIKSHQIAAQRDRWLLEGPRRRMKRDRQGRVVVEDRRIVWESVPEPLGASAVNHRLRALSNFFTVMNGRRSTNPVLEVDEASAPDETPRAIPAEVVAAIFDKARDESGGTRGTDPKTYVSKIRARCLRWTGIAPVDLQRVRRHHIQIEQERVWITPRRKGKRRKKAKQAPAGRWQHLVPEAVEAFRDLIDADAVGPFSVSALNKWFQRMARAAGFGGLGLRIYDLRHTVGTDTYEASGDIHAVAEALGQRDLRSTKRYVEGAVNPRVKAALQAMRQKVTGKVTGNGKGAA